MQINCSLTAQDGARVPDICLRTEVRYLVSPSSLVTIMARPYFFCRSKDSGG